MRTKKLLTMVLLAAVIVLNGCSALAPKPAALSDEEVLSATDNILKAIDSGDYAAFSEDFGEEMLGVMTESEFTKIQDLLAESSGAFQSCGEAKLVNQQDFAVYRFPCQYEKEEVTVTVVLPIDGTTVDGLFFDSPNIRNSTAE